MKTVIYIIAAILIIGCSNNKPMTKFEYTKCIKNKELAESSGSGIIIECE